MTPLEKLVRVPLMERTRDEEDNVVNHVCVGDVVKEGTERLDGIAPQEVELVDEELGCLVVDS